MYYRDVIAAIILFFNVLLKFIDSSPFKIINKQNNYYYTTFCPLIQGLSIQLWIFISSANTKDLSAIPVVDIAQLQQFIYAVISKRELESVIRSAGSIESVLDEKCKDQDTYLLIKYLDDSAKFEKLLDNPLVLRQPIVRNGQQATIGYQPEVWKTWE